MSATHVCPHCGTQGYSGHPVDLEAMIRCSNCGEHYVRQAPVAAMEAFDVPRRRPTEALVAGGIAVALVAAVATALVLAGGEKSSSEPKPSAATDAEHRRLEAQQRELAEARLQLERDRLRFEQERLAADEAAAVAKARDEKAAADAKQAARADDMPPAEPRAAPADDNAARALAEYEDFMRKGERARDGKRYDEALRAYNEALLRRPNDEAAVAARQEVTKLALDLKDRANRQDQFAGHMDRAATALRGHRYDAAIEAFDAALKLFPTDREAQQGLTQAKQAKKNAKGNLKKLIDQGNLALQNQRLGDAAKAFAEAAELAPNDPVVQRLQQQTARWLQQDQTGQGAFAQAMMQGAWSFQIGQYANAVRAFTEALRLAPGDFDAQQGLLESRARLSGAVVNRAEYERRLLLANQALQSNRFADAIREFNEVLRLLPNDPVALTGLRRASYGQAMNQARAAMTTRRYADAVRFFEEALAAIPGDQQATMGLRQARAFRR